MAVRRAPGVPLIPAGDQCADGSVTRFKSFESEIAGCEIILFIKTRIIGNVHFAIKTQNASIGIDDHGAVMIEARCTTFKYRNNDRNLVVSGRFLKGSGDGPGMVSARSKVLKSSFWQKY